MRIKARTNPDSLSLPAESKKNRSRRPSVGRTIIVTNTTNASPPPMLRMACDGSLSKLAKTMANKHQATASSIAPAPIATVPINVPWSPLKWMIRASMGKAVMHIEAPRNSIASVAVVRSGNNPPQE